jgi:23S rRNA (cytidine1920-2'-O)/16S rRNA (cytidine1409-2'-O)-methyltransferase
VLVSGAQADKPSRLVAGSEPVVLVEPRRFVSRGGRKLEAALETFAVDVSGSICLDAGASTGGFTDCLLKRGAGRVWAVDVGHGQLSPEIRANPRVVAIDGCNLRHATLETLMAPGHFEVVVADLSFISLRVLARKLSAELAAPGADIVVLVKPQFEAGRDVVSRGRGVVRDPAQWRDCLLKVGTAFAAAGAAIMGVMASPILGPAGNAEFLVHLRHHGAPGQTNGIDPELSSAGAIESVARAIETARSLTREPGSESGDRTEPS